MYPSIACQKKDRAITTTTKREPFWLHTPLLEFWAREGYGLEEREAFAVHPWTLYEQQFISPQKAHFLKPNSRFANPKTTISQLKSSLESYSTDSLIPRNYHQRGAPDCMAVEMQITQLSAR